MYYSVFKGFNKGIYKSWKECEKEVKGYKGAIYKKFKLESDAILFLNNGVKKEERNIIKVYTDGSCINNGKKGSKAGIGIFFGNEDKRNVSRKLNLDRVTNNVAELSALIEALDILKNESRDVIIYTDSKYCILCCTSYGDKQRLKDWSDNIPNKDLVMEVYNKYREKDNIRLEYVIGHSNIYENEMADKLAREATSK
jgi:ribonuclease HI|tara:strand:- start:207 stop:800 length:594 start_codon:yes stop_codon:yes gene_type:complete